MFDILIQIHYFEMICLLFYELRTFFAFWYFFILPKYLL